MDKLKLNKPDEHHATHPEVEDYTEIADKVRTGEYYREARRMYDYSVHDPMAERYMYLFITAISIIIFIIALVAARSLYPLNSEVPLIFYSNDVTEDIPNIEKLQEYKDESPSEATLRFLVKHYVQMREEYEISTFDRNVNGIKNQSSEDVFREYQFYIDPRNPDGPITKYQRHSRRYIQILLSKRLPDSMEVIFDAYVDSRSTVKKSRWRANIAFKYSGVALDDEGDKVKAVKFLVTKYHSKRLQDR